MCSPKYWKTSKRLKTLKHSNFDIKTKTFFQQKMEVWIRTGLSNKKCQKTVTAVKLGHYFVTDCIVAQINDLMCETQILKCYCLKT